MLSSIATEVIIIVALTVMNGVFAMAEISLVSSRKARLQRMADMGSSKAKATLRLAESPSEFLATVQVGITLVGIFAGAFGGATIAEQLAAMLSAHSSLAPYAETISIILVVLGITYVSLIIGELVPKRIALNAPERFAVMLSGPMRVLSRIAAPGVRVLSLSSDFVLWLLRIKKTEEPPVTEEELRTLLRQGTTAGVFEIAERDMVENVFRFASRSVNAIMTPRQNVVAISVSDTAATIREKIQDSGHSRFPLCEGSLDNVIGVVTAKDLLVQQLSDSPLRLREAMHEAPSVPETAPALKALELLKQSDSPLAFVVDEYGGLTGVVTVNDLVGSILGQLPEVEQPTIVARADGSWLADGLLPIDRVKDIAPIASLTERESYPFTTLAGFMLDGFGRLPTASDTFERDGFRFEVVDMDGRRVDKVLITPPKKLEAT